MHESQYLKWIDLLCLILSQVLLHFFPIFNAWCFVPFDKELDWEWKEKKTPGKKEAEETNSPGETHPMCKKKKIGVLDF